MLLNITGVLKMRANPALNLAPFGRWTLRHSAARRLALLQGLMKFLHNPHKIAGSLFLLAAILILPFWYILLFVAQPSNVPVFESAATTLSYMFSAENPARTYLIWHAVAPLAAATLSGSYFLLRR